MAKILISDVLLFSIGYSFISLVFGDYEMAVTVWLIAAGLSLIGLLRELGLASYRKL